MINIYYHRGFLKELKKLPKEIKIKYIDLEEIFKTNPLDPRLFSKKLAGKFKNHYSFRITREYRVIFNFVADQEVVFLQIGHRKDIYS